MTKAREIRDMADEQIRLVWKDAAEALFRLRLQAQTEKLASPAEVRKYRRTIARCQTVLSQRGTLIPAAASAAAPDSEAMLHDKHAKRHRAAGRAKIRARKPGEVKSRRTFKKRTQSGK
ncbi:MAG: 50S ribosomal protein L29 [Planctomycetaceae bacterium]